MYDLPLMNHYPESLECRVIVNLIESWKRDPVIMAEILEEAKADYDNGKNYKAVSNAITDYRQSISKERKIVKIRKLNALSLLDNYTVKETSFITGISVKTIQHYINEQKPSTIAV